MTVIMHEDGVASTLFQRLTQSRSFSTSSGPNWSASRKLVVECSARSPGLNPLAFCVCVCVCGGGICKNLGVGRCTMLDAQRSHMFSFSSTLLALYLLKSPVTSAKVIETFTTHFSLILNEIEFFHGYKKT